MRNTLFCPVRLITYNVNGIRAAMNKSFDQWLRTAEPDVLCLQEIKTSQEDFPGLIFSAFDYKWFLFPAERKGYSGTAILSRQMPDEVLTGIGVQEFDAEGRLIQARFGSTWVASVYFPSGSSGEHRQQSKFRFLEVFLPWAICRAREVKKLVICGDFNICHRPIDIHDPVSNKNSSGFLPEERAWMEKYLSSGFTDAFRYLHPDEAHQYTWWSFRANARQKNKGWRIDYITLVDSLVPALKRCIHLPEARHSDHCPVLAELEDSLLM